MAEAVAIASPVLTGQIDAVLAGRPTDAGRTRRMALALARYWVRMHGRATPFGAFAGVSSARFGPRLSVRWTDGHQVHTRADTLWLAPVIARLEASVGLRRRLSVVMNDQVVVRGERLVVAWAPHGSISGSRDEVSVRLIPVVRTVMSLARSPLRGGDLIDKLAAEHPGAPVEGLEAVVGELMARGVLISSLRAPSTATDALAHLLDRLHDADVTDLPETCTLVSELLAIHEQLQGSGRTAPWIEERGRRETTARMRGLSTATDQPVTVDLRLGCDLVLPQAVADEAAAAAEALIRLSPAPTGNVSWREYHGRFLSQYGPCTPVAVEQLIDPVRGLGFPRHFASAHPNIRELTARDEALLALAQHAALDGAREVTLDENRIDALTGGKGQRPVSPVDLWVDVRVATAASLDDGDFTLAVCGFGRLAASTGRFLHLFDEPVRKQVTDLPTGVDGALAAQLSFPPEQVRQENVQRVQRVLADVITLAEYGESAVHRIPVRDLAVAADRNRLYVVSLAGRQVVEPMLLHSGARHTMPPLARLLFEIPRSAHPQVTGFDWGAAARLPFLPRVRYGRSILTPAQWRLDPAELPGPEATSYDWSEALESVRARRRLPAGITVGSGDRQLRLNLDKPMDLALLRAHLDATPASVTVAEAPTAADHGWFDGRAHEIVVRLTATAPPTEAPAFLRGPAMLPLIASEPRKDVVHAKLYGHPELFDALLTEHVPHLMACWDTPPQWWFIRYRHPAPHLRLRVHDSNSARAAGRVAAWAEDLRERGLLGEISFATCQPEVGRYGSGAAMEAAEALFAADSAAVLTQLRAQAAFGGLHPQALTAASLVDLAGAMTGSRAAGLRWLTDHPDLATNAPLRDRDVRQQTLQIANGRMLHRLPGGEAIAAAWAARSQAAARYAARLTPESTQLTPGSVLTALLHMHHIRALGVDAETEGMTHKLARSVALAQAARQSAEERDGE
ncbi:lantibiotic dehydratase [Streptomyces sp. NPDC058572]|uniref:lantibiotic dehydratase n=1 Tax=Streptomyces sp. NPDC058572 TaxID=3346546 RepID=UPI00364B1C8D